MSWTSDIDTIITGLDPITRTYLLEVQSGYDDPDIWTEIPIAADSWTMDITEGFPAIGILKLKPVLSDFSWMDERSTPALTQTALTGTVTFPALAPYQMVGVGTLFLSELHVGQHVALDGDPNNWAIVSEIVSNLQCTLLYPYPGWDGLSDKTDTAYTFYFTATNILQMASAVRLLCIVYKDTETNQAGTVSGTNGSAIFTGNGTDFTSTLERMTWVNIAGYPFAGVLVKRIIDATSFEGYTLSPIDFTDIAYATRDDERNYIFRGTIKRNQKADADCVLEAYDYLDRLQHCSVRCVRESTLLGPYANVVLRHAAAYDLAGEFYTWEIDPALLPQARVGEDANYPNRAWKPGSIVIEKWNALAVPPAYEKMAASEFEIDEPLGLVLFSNSQLAGDSIRIVSVSLYQEGTFLLDEAIELGLTQSIECESGAGAGFLPELLRTAISGHVTFSPASPYMMTGDVNTKFLTELYSGQRVALDADPSHYAIISVVMADDQCSLVIPYQAWDGVTTFHGSAFVSSLEYSGVSIASMRWLHCNGSVAQFLQKLQENYSDSVGYRIWFDYAANLIRGRRIAIDFNYFKQLGPKQHLNILESIEDVYSGVSTKGKTARAVNLTTAPTTEIITPTLAEIQAFVPGVGQGFGDEWPSSPPEQVMSWETDWADSPELAIKDANTGTAFMVYVYSLATADIPKFFDFFYVDLDALTEISQIVAYAPNCKNPNMFKYGITILGATDLAGPWEPVCLEAFEVDLAPDEVKTFDCTNLQPIRYLKVQMRFMKWMADGPHRTFGLRELIIFGSQEICKIVCIQDTMPPGNTLMTPPGSTITFDACDEPPYTVTGTGTAFVTGGAGGAIVAGDWIAAGSDLSVFAKVLTVISDSVLHLESRYLGVAGTTGNLRKAAFQENVGGHFLGGSSLYDDFIIDYHPNLCRKLRHVLPQIYPDFTSMVFTANQAKDRAYVILNEMIRCYRQVAWQGDFDPRFQIYETARVLNDYMPTPEQIFCLVQNISMSDSSCTISGTEYGAGVLR